MSETIPIFLPKTICDNRTDILKCFENINSQKCQDLKDNISKFISDSDTSGIDSFKQGLTNSEVETFLKDSSKTINNTFNNIYCIIDAINSNSKLNLTEKEKIKPFDETSLRYNFIKDIVQDNEHLKNKLFDNLGGKHLKTLNILSLIFIIILSGIIFYLIFKNN